MTLTQQNRSRLTGLITNHRSKWDSAGVEAAIKTLDLRHPNDPLHVVALAVAAARDPKALTPAAMHNRPVDLTPTAAVKAAPRHDDPECALHGGTAKRDDGRFVCCAQEAATARPTSPVAASLRSAVPPPAGLREQVAQALNVNPREAAK